MIAIVDYGVGNARALANMLRSAGADPVITSDRDELSAAGVLFLPGVGAFDTAMEELERSGLIPVLERKALVERVPVLGVCLGMQLLTRGSEEGRKPGLGWVPGFARRIPAEKVPHMKWSPVEIVAPSVLAADLAEDARFYFAHSYHVELEAPAQPLLRVHYGVPLTAAFGYQHIYGVQFHPEKSHRFGRTLLKNFLALAGGVSRSS